MSLDGLARMRGSTVTHSRAGTTGTRALDGSRRYTWTDIATGVRVPLEPITSELAERIWGHEVKATMRALWPRPLAAPVVRDLITVTAGRHAGQTYQVAAVLDHGLATGSPHYEVGLAVTPERI